MRKEWILVVTDISHKSHNNLKGKNKEDDSVKRERQ